MKLPTWLTKPSPWIFYPLVAGILVVDYVLASNKTQALIWIGALIVIGGISEFRRRRKD